MRSYVLDIDVRLALIPSYYPGDSSWDKEHSLQCSLLINETEGPALC